MGEYARRGDASIKLGTCEELYYVTRADIEALASSGWRGEGGNHDLRSYLECKPCRVRLPGPWSELAGCENTIGKREMGTRPEFRIAIDPDFASALGEVEHGRMCHHAGGTNFFIPCPFGKDEPKVKTSGLHPHIMLSGEGLGNGRAIYRCPYCNAAFNLMGHPLQMAVALAFEEQWNGKFGGDGKRYEYLLGLIRAGQEAGAAT